MLNKEESLRWLQWRMEGYRSNMNDIGVVEGFDDMGKLGSGVVSSDELKVVNISDGDVKGPTYISGNLSEAQRGGVLELLREFADYFA
jgi:hypothetical protein